MKGDEPMCRLCGKVAELRLSHVIPRFVVQWMKKTGGGYFRQVIKPNVRQQDGPKQKLLCEECEQRFSARESYLANTIFNPVVNEEKSDFVYDSRLFYALISILWRALVAGPEDGAAKFPMHKALFEEAESDWRVFLLNPERPPKFDQLHLFISGIADATDVPIKRLNAYLARAIDATPAGDEKRCFMFVKFSRLLIFAHLNAYPAEKWVGTQVLPGGGKLGIPQFLNDSAIGGFLLSRVDEMNIRFDSQASSKTKEVIRKHYEKTLPGLVGKDLFKVQLADHMQGTSRTGAIRTKIGRNDPCPCGSGKKFKHCHGA
jgi:hypothetical protein